MLGTTGSMDKLASVLFGKAQQAVLGLLFGRPDESFYVREIVCATRVGQGAVQRELQRLAEAGIIDRVVRGRTVYRLTSNLGSRPWRQNEASDLTTLPL
jgi:DNA-binding transcriptional ArsR family regulator